MYGFLRYKLTTIVGKKDCDKGGEILPPVLKRIYSFQKAGLSGRLDQEKD
jgi:hypothetical protein